MFLQSCALLSCDSHNCTPYKRAGATNVLNSHSLACGPWTVHRFIVSQVSPTQHNLYSVTLWMLLSRRNEILLNVTSTFEWFIYKWFVYSACCTLSWNWYPAYWAFTHMGAVSNIVNMVWPTPAEKLFSSQNECRPLDVIGCLPQSIYVIWNLTDVKLKGVGGKRHLWFTQWCWQPCQIFSQSPNISWHQLIESIDPHCKSFATSTICSHCMSLACGPVLKQQYILLLCPNH